MNLSIRSYRPNLRKFTPSSPGKTTDVDDTLESEEIETVVVAGEEVQSAVTGMLTRNLVPFMGLGLVALLAVVVCFRRRQAPVDDHLA